MADDRFFWVNKTPSSRSLTNVFDDDRARYLLNSHIHSGRKHTKRRLREIEIQSHSASASIAQWIKNARPNDQPNTYLRPSKTHDKDEPNSRQLKTQIIPRHGSIDPFDSLPVKIDSNAHSLMQFYVQNSSDYPMVWDSRTSLSHDSTLSTIDVSNKIRYYTTLSLTAAVMELFGNREVATRLGTPFAQQALAEIRSQVKSGTMDDAELMYGISRVFLAAVLQGDEFGARAHLKAAKYFADKAGGLDSFAASSINHIRYGDLHLAVRSLSAPVFAPVNEPGDALLEEYETNPCLEQRGRNLLQVSQKHFPASLHGALERIITCTIILESIWAHPTPSRTRLEWTASQCGDTLTLLLNITFSSGTKVALRKMWEAAKVSMILWVQVLVLLLNETIGAVAPIKKNILTVNDGKIVMMNEIWPSCVSGGVKDWNKIVNFEHGRKGPDRPDSDSLLIGAVELTEAQSFIRLGPFIHELLSLRESHGRLGRWYES